MFMIYLHLFEYIIMKCDYIMLYLDGFLMFVEDDLFLLTLGGDRDMNCAMLIILN